jgi:transcriptional regulator with XRE-family HTH domain
MPKVKPLTQKQRDAERRLVIRTAIKAALMAKNGESGLMKEDFAREMGISPGTWVNWRRTDLANVTLDDILAAAQKVGVPIKIVIRGEEYGT